MTGEGLLEYAPVGASILICLLIVFMRHEIASLEHRNAEIEQRLSPQLE